MSSLHKTASWVIVNLKTGEAILETFNFSLTEKINKAKYKVVPILEYLGEFNRVTKLGQTTFNR
jgi:hypothetical protein